ncbi:MAG: thioredoxin family protein [Anaerolineae bacterium]|nr:thioredoxin family protein [Anaerolineae bacterium]
MLTIKILGGGCAKCKQLEAETRAALQSMNQPLDYEIVKVTDMAEIAAYQVMATPALVINEQVLSYGRIPKRDQIIQWAIEAHPLN